MNPHYSHLPPHMNPMPPVSAVPPHNYSGKKNETGYYGEPYYSMINDNKYK